MTPLSKILIILIRTYQTYISSLTVPRCRFQPTCSQYGIKIIKKFGTIKGIWITSIRILKCHPFTFKK